MIFNSFCSMRNAIIVLMLIGLTACRKKTRDLLSEDLSIATASSFNDVRFVGNAAIIVGGQRFDQSDIYYLDENKVARRIDLPANSTGKELYGIDLSATGTLLAVGYDASVLCSHDSGSHWQFIQNGTWKIFQDIAFRDQDTAFVVSGLAFNQGGLASVDKNGEGSNFLLAEKNFALDDVEFVTPQTGYMCGYGALMKTTDAGRSWTFTTAQNDYYKSMSWKNELEGIAVGYAGSIIKTIDGGQHWQTCRDGNNFFKKKIHLLAVAYNGLGTYLACGENGCVCMSDDEGEHWREVEHFSSKDLHGLRFKNPNECLVVGEEGGLYLLKL